MAKGIYAGMTDYSHQTLDDIREDLKTEIANLKSEVEYIEENIQNLISNEYWNTNVPNNFKGHIRYCLRAYKTAIQEFNEISKEIETNVEQHHINRLKRIANTANEINVAIGKLWHQDYNETYKNYGDANFTKVEQIYCTTRDLAVNLLDFDNAAYRLEDYIGKSKNMKKNNPWVSGSFYLLVAVIILVLIAVLSQNIPWYTLPIIIIGGILIIGVIGALQLKNDDKLSDKSFVDLMTETFKSLPLLNKSK